MALLTAQPVSAPVTRTYSVEVPDNPPQASIPAIIVFHGGGQEVATIAARWGVHPPAPVPALVQNYLLVFPETHPQLDDEWVHYGPGNSAFPTLDLDFVRDLIAELTTRAYATTSVAVPTVTADPSLLYAAGFSNGGGLVWQLLNSDLSASFQRLRGRGQGAGPGEGDPVPTPAGGERRRAGAGADGLHPGHRRHRLPAAVHPAGAAGWTRRCRSSR